MTSNGIIPSLIALLRNKSNQPDHLYFIALGVLTLESCLSRYTPARIVFRSLNGAESMIERIFTEVLVMFTARENPSRRVYSSAKKSVSLDLLALTPAPFTQSHRVLLNVLLCSLSASIATLSGGALQTLRDADGPITKSFKLIFDNSLEFGGALFGVAAALLCDLINNDPQSLKEVYENGVATSFLSVLSEGRVPLSIDCIRPLPNVIRSLCLTSDVSTYLLNQRPLEHMLNMYIGSEICENLDVESAVEIGIGLDELMRHVTTLREPGVNAMGRVISLLADAGSKLHKEWRDTKEFYETHRKLHNQITMLGKCLLEVFRDSNNATAFIEHEEYLTKLLELYRYSLPINNSYLRALVKLNPSSNSVACITLSECINNLSMVKSVKVLQCMVSELKKCALHLQNKLFSDCVSYDDATRSVPDASPRPKRACIFDQVINEELPKGSFPKIELKFPDLVQKAKDNAFKEVENIDMLKLGGPKMKSICNFLLELEVCQFFLQNLVYLVKSYQPERGQEFELGDKDVDVIQSVLSEMSNLDALLFSQLGRVAFNDHTAREEITVEQLSLLGIKSVSSN